MSNNEYFNTESDNKIKELGFDIMYANYNLNTIKYLNVDACKSITITWDYNDDNKCTIISEHFINYHNDIDCTVNRIGISAELTTEEANIFTKKINEMRNFIKIGDKVRINPVVCHCEYGIVIEKRRIPKESFIVLTRNGKITSALREDLLKTGESYLKELNNLVKLI